MLTDRQNRRSEPLISFDHSAGQDLALVVSCVRYIGSRYSRKVPPFIHVFLSRKRSLYHTIFDPFFRDKIFPSLFGRYVRNY